MSRTARSATVVAVILSLLMLAGCGGDASSDDRTDPADVTAKLTADGKLKEPVEVTINVASRAVLDFSAPLLADELGVLEEYGIDLKVEAVPTTEAVPLLATGKLDVLIGGLNAGLFNAISGGSDLRVVAPANYQDPASTIGIWASTKWLDGQQISADLLKGSTHASSQGSQGVTMVKYVELLEKYGVEPDEVNVETLAQTDQVVALETGAVSTGTPSPAGTATLDESGAAQFVTPQVPDGWPVTVLMFGPSLLDEHPEVGMAFVAAMRSLYADQLAPGYQDDPTVFDALVKVSEQTPDDIKQATPFIYKSELSIPDDYISRCDETWRMFPGVLQSEEPLTFDDVVDTRFMDYANGLEAAG